MYDLVVVVPSRGRPDRLKVMLEEAVKLSEADTLIAVALDEDDPELAAYEETLAVQSQVMVFTGPRIGMVPWTNMVASEFLGQTKAFGSMGDDHVPRTPGWDRLLLEALEGLGGEGFVYPDDKRRADVPEAVVVSSGVVEALGWLALPEVRHYFCDNAWSELGRRSSLIKYCPHVLIEHVHYTISTAPRDVTYSEAEELYGNRDRLAFNQWRTNQMPGQVALLRRKFNRDLDWVLGKV